MNAGPSTMWSALAPICATGIAAGLAAAGVMSLRPGRVPLFRDSAQRLLTLGRTPALLSTLAAAAATIGGILAAGIAFGAGQPVAALAVAGVGYWAFGWGLKYLIQRDERLLRNQVGDFAVAMAGATRAGMSAAQAIGRTAESFPRPVQAHLQRVFEDYQRGATLRDALVATRNRLTLDAFDLFSTAIVVTTERGGRLEEALERIASSIHDQQRLEDKLDALTSSGRSALIVLGLFPFAFAGFFYSIDPSGYHVMLESFMGRAAVGGAIVTVFLALRWGKAILDAVG